MKRSIVLIIVICATVLATVIFTSCGDETTVQPNRIDKAAATIATTTAIHGAKKSECASCSYFDLKYKFQLNGSFST